MLLGIFLLLGSQPAFAETAPDKPPIPDSAEIDAAIPEGESLTGRQIYARFLRNRNRESDQKMRVVSRDPGGNEALSRFNLRLKDYRDENDEAVDGILAKVLIRVSYPSGVRHTGYLIITKDPGPDDQFAYLSSMRRVRRVDLKHTSLLGTDFTFYDVAFQDIEDSDYVRLPDEVIDGTPVYVVETQFKDTTESDYHHIVMYLEKEHYVPLRVRYWDEFDVEVKEMKASQSSIRSFGDVWVATESTMTNLLEQTSSTLWIDQLDTEPDFESRHFSTSVLMRGR